jgi:hypothetical protein
VSPHQAHGLVPPHADANERRAVPRVRPSLPLSARVMATQPARIIDISSRGAQIELASALQPSGPCDLRIEFAEGEFAAHATVRRCHASGFDVDELHQSVILYRAGLEFDQVDPECLAWLTANVLYQAEA